MEAQNKLNIIFVAHGNILLIVQTALWSSFHLTKSRDLNMEWKWSFNKVSLD